MTPEEVMRLRRDLAAIGTRIEELRSAIKEHSEAIHAAEEAHNENDAVHKSIPVTVSYDEQINKDQNRQYGTQEEISKWTKGAVIAAAIYAAIAAFQWCEMRKETKAATKAADAAANQTGLMRQQLENTLAANIVIGDPQVSNRGLQVIITNIGHIYAPHAHLYIEVQRQSFPLLGNIGEPEKHLEDVPQVTPATNQNTGNWFIFYPLKPLSHEYLSQHETITVKEVLDFDNGFSHWFHAEWCGTYIGHYQILSGPNGNEASGPGFWPCPEVSLKIAYLKQYGKKPEN